MVVEHIKHVLKSNLSGDTSKLFGIYQFYLESKSHIEFLGESNVIKLTISKGNNEFHEPIQCHVWQDILIKEWAIIQSADIVVKFFKDNPVEPLPHGIVMVSFIF